jgi:hypothetical protein
MHKLSAKDFVTVQAMSQPTGLVFFIDHQFGTTRKGFTAGDSIYGTSFVGSSGDFNYQMDTDTTKGMYGAGKWGYSLNNVTASYLLGAITPVSQSSVTAADYQNDTRFSVSYASQLADGRIKKLTIATPTYADKNGFDAFYIYNAVASGSNAGYIVKQFKEYTRIGTSTLDFIVLTGHSGSWTDGVTLSYHKQPLTYDRGDFEYRGDDLQSDDIGIPEVQFKLTQKPIVP